MAGIIVLLVLPVSFSASLSAWAARRGSPRWTRVALGVGFLHGAVLWGLLVLGYWRSAYGATDAAIGVFAIAMAGLLAAVAHFLVSGLAVLIARRIGRRRTLGSHEKGVRGRR